MNKQTHLQDGHFTHENPSPGGTPLRTDKDKIYALI